MVKENQSISRSGSNEASVDNNGGNRGPEVGTGCALSAGHRSDAGGWRPDQGGRENEPWGILDLGGQEVERRLADLQLLRSRSQRLLVTSPASGAGSQEPGGGAQGDGSRRQEAKDR